MKGGHRRVANDSASFRQRMTIVRQASKQIFFDRHAQWAAVLSFLARCHEEVTGHVQSTCLRASVVGFLLGMSSAVSHSDETSIEIEISDTEVATYQAQSGPLSAILSAAPLPYVVVSPDRQWLLLTHHREAPGIRDLASPSVSVLRLEIDPRTGGHHADQSADGTGMTLVRVADAKRWTIPVPTSGVSVPLWSPDSRRFIFRRTTDDQVELWMGSVLSKEARRIEGTRLSALLGSSAPCSWLRDSRRVLCQEIPHRRGIPPSNAATSIRPVVQETRRGQSHGFIYKGRLRSAADVAAYEYYRVSQPVLIDLDTATRTRIGSPAIFDYFDPSPDGRYYLSVRTVPPYSTTYADEYRFPKLIEIWNSQGEVVHRLGERGIGTWGELWEGWWAPPLRRRFAWLPDSPASISFIEALDGGDPRTEAEYRDRWMRLDAPFSGRPLELLRTRGRMPTMPELTRFVNRYEFANIAWLQRGVAWVEEMDIETRRKRVWRVNTLDLTEKPRVLLSLGPNDRFDQSWNALLRRGGDRQAVNDYEDPVLQQDGPSVFLSGRSDSSGYPYLDRLNTQTSQRERLFQPANHQRELPVAVLSNHRILTRIESPEDPPNYLLRNLQSGEVVQITENNHPAPELRNMESRTISYVREDGVPLRAELYLPTNYRYGQKVPVFVWAYPRNYEDAAAAVGRTRPSKNVFTWDWRRRFEVIVRLLNTQGYAIAWEADMPIIGGAEANDSAVEQMVANARALVEKLTDLGVADPAQIALGGHSYGATMTAVLLAHTDFFAAGVAVDGGYNLTNHPMGFQQERRSVWAAPQVYRQLSALMDAERIDAPILLIHGELDDNYLTPPVESERLFQALDSLGRTARLVLLPHEGHAPIARESIEHIAWEITRWLDCHVKFAQTACGSTETKNSKGTPPVALSVQLEMQSGSVVP